MSVNFSASFTKATRQYNGFTDPEIEPKISDPTKEQDVYVCVSLTKRKFLKVEDDKGTLTPTMEHQHIEAVLDPDEQDLVKKILKRRLQERTGLTGDEPDPGLFEVDNEGRASVPEASGEEIMAERAEAKAAQGEG